MDKWMQYRLSISKYGRSIVFLALVVFLNTTIFIPYMDFNDLGISLIEPVEEEEEGESEKELEYDVLQRDREEKWNKSNLVYRNSNYSKLLENYGEIFTPPPERC